MTSYDIMNSITYLVLCFARTRMKSDRVIGVRECLAINVYFSSDELRI